MGGQFPGSWACLGKMVELPLLRSPTQSISANLCRLAQQSSKGSTTKLPGQAYPAPVLKAVRVLLNARSREHLRKMETKRGTYARSRS